MKIENSPVLWITGAGSGIGRSVAVAAAQLGWLVVLTGRREEALEESAELVRRSGSEALVLPLDVGRDDLPSALSEVISKWGRIDAVVLAAGMNAPNRRWEDQSMTDFDDIVRTNLTGVTRSIDAALPSLRATGGIAVVISSYAGWTFLPDAGVAYGASKAALSMLTRTLNQQEARHGVRACHLCPSDTNTGFLRQRKNIPGAEARAKMLSPDDVGRAIMFVLASPAHVRIDELVISPVSQT